MIFTQNFLLSGVAILMCGALCPDTSQWSLTAKAKCNRTHPEYYCLFDENRHLYTESCMHAVEYQRPGYKFVIRGGLDGKLCDDAYFQPIKFWTNGSNECIFLKSDCTDEGQIISYEGNSTSDRTCKCDYTKGYAFVTEPNDGCTCFHGGQDCSCYKKLCKHSEILSPDYNCIRIINWMGQFRCPKIEAQRRLSSITPSTKLRLQGAVKEDELKNVIENERIVYAAKVGLVVFIAGFFFSCTKFYYVLDCTNKEPKKKKKLELEEEQNEKIPKKIREIHQQRLTDWFEQDKIVIQTNAMQRVEDHLRTSNCVLLAGSSGNGKSSILRHIALRMSQEEGFDIIPIVMGPSDIQIYYNPVRKQVFVLDDFCGKDQINQDDIDIWASRIADIQVILEPGLQFSASKHIQQSTTKLLIACEAKIYHDKRFNPLRILDKYKLNLSDYPLTDKEKSDIIAILWDNCAIEELKCDQAYYPFLCRLSEGKALLEIKNMFIRPYSFIEKDIKRLQKDDPLQFFVITLCTLFDNEIKIEWFTDDAPSSKKDALQYSLDELNLKLDKELFLTDITEMTYMNKAGNAYNFIHKDIYDIAANICGETHKSFFIDHASSIFIGERYSFESQSAIETDPRSQRILLHKDYKERYFNRLLNDLKNGNFYSSFHNVQLKDNSYRSIFCSFLKSNRTQIADSLKQFKQADKEQPLTLLTQNESNANSNIVNTPEDGYSSLKSKDFFRSYKTSLPLIEAAWEGYTDIIELLIEMNSGVNDTDAFGRSAVFVASLLGNKNAVQLLLDKNADISLCDNKARSPLYAACDEGHHKIVDLLIEKNADVSMCDTEGQAPLHVSCAGGHKLITERLLRKNGSLVNKCDKRGKTPLFYAVEKGHTLLTDVLINNNANVNTCDNEGHSPLYIACKEGYENIVDILMRKNAKILHRDASGKSSLWIACYEGKTKIVEKICKEMHSIGENINQCDSDNKSPLYIASEKGNYEIVKILLQSKTKVNTCDRQNRSPLYVACKHGHLDIVILLIENGADVLLCNQWKDSPLHVACREGHTDVVTHLISKNADVSMCNETEISPLLYACRKGYPEIVKLLLARNGSLINKCDVDKQTPLHAAAFGGHMAVVQILVNSNAKRCQDTNGQLPAELALKQGHVSIANLLQAESNKH